MAIARASLVAALVLTLATPALAADRAEAIDRTALRVCADPAAMPSSAEDGSGYENQIAALLGKELGVPVAYTWFPTGNGFYRRTLNARRCDLVIGTVVGDDIAQTTIPYYRSAYVLVTRAADNIAAAKVDDPALKALTLGVQSNSPAADALARAGMLDRMRAYTLTSDGTPAGIGKQMVDDVIAQKIDGAILWGPIGGHFAALHPGALRVEPLAHGNGASPLAFEIGMAVRYGEPQWRARVDRFIRENRAPVQAILAAAHVPLLPLTEATP